MNKADKITILQIGTSDFGGGAEGTAQDLHNSFNKKGHKAYLAVGRKYGSDENTFEIPRPLPQNPALKWLRKLADFCRNREYKRTYLRRISRILQRFSEPIRFSQWWNGREEFHYPGTSQLLDICPEKPDIIHCHNLHGYYFDLNFLIELSKEIPVILNLHDAWLLTGHCSHFFDCQKWQTGCGNCPDLSIYPAIRKDATAENWQKKAAIYQKSNLYVTAPSAWLLEKAKISMLQAKEYRLIPNSIDCQVFYPENRKQARQRLQLPENKKIVLFCAASKKSIFKDPNCMTETILRLAEKDPAILFICIGAKAALPALKAFSIVYLPFLNDATILADYYRAADVFVHTAKAETFGKTVTEAMACATPVVASRVGGITEQLIEGKTGELAETGNAKEMAEKISKILNMKENEKKIIDQNAAEQGKKYAMENQVNALLKWYREIRD